MNPKHPLIRRSMPLLDLDVSGLGGRTVTAYVATFAEPYEVSDQFGHYDEEINRAAFNRAAGRGFPRAQPLFNHGMTVHLTPSEKWSTPLGVPELIKPDGRGLLTVTRYNQTPQADEVLEMLRSGSVRYNSFRGPAIRSARPRQGPNGRPVVERLEMGLIDYGPAVIPVNMGAETLAIRSQALAEEIGELSPDERRDFIAQLQQALHVDPPSAPDPQPQPVAVPVAPEVSGPSVDLLALANANRRRRRHH